MLILEKHFEELTVPSPSLDSTQSTGPPFLPALLPYPTPQYSDLLFTEGDSVGRMEKVMAAPEVLPVQSPEPGS